MGSSEAAYCGTPVVATPMYGDQFLNSAAFVNREMGAIVHYEDITKHNVLAALKVALHPTTRQNAKKVSHSYKNRILTPKKTAIWWAEHVAATGGAPLTKSHAVFMSGWAYHSLDVIGVLLIVALAVIASWVWAIRKLCCSAKRETKRKLKSQ